ncbi:LAETG motif-containing sortase-dependent surface protein [Streptomyces sediminimaris]|uniref:LAETG motif-containing sortase-dependent surface protein n=1 Tax=Streptomyces sediminimaris TaxID=3383721 RepID=UPI00399A8B65
MKLRRAMAAAAATAAIAPIALLSAPAAFATESPGASATASAETDGTSTTTGQSSTTGDGTSSSTGDQSSTSGDSTTSSTDGQNTDTAKDATTPDGKSSASADDTTSSADDQNAKTGEDTTTPDGKNTPSGSAPSPTSTAPDEWTPDACDKYNLDDNLEVKVNGLPSKIVAGSGWHNFTFSVKNNSDVDLKNVWVDTYTEYADGVNMNDSLAWDLAQIQFKDPKTGKWTDSYQDSYTDGGTKDTVVATGTFIGIIDAVDKGAKVDMDLRVRVGAKAPAGSSFAMSSAVYAGKGTDCNGNGDTYQFTVLKAGSKPSGVGDAKPSGDKPTTKPKTNMEPQGGSEQLPVTGSLAETGSSSMLPVIGLTGGVAVVAGAGALFVVRRRRGAGSNAAA